MPTSILLGQHALPVRDPFTASSPCSMCCTGSFHSFLLSFWYCYWLTINHVILWHIIWECMLNTSFLTLYFIFFLLIFFSKFFPSPPHLTFAFSPLAYPLIQSSLVVRCNQAHALGELMWTLAVTSKHWKCVSTNSSTLFWKMLSWHHPTSTLRVFCYCFTLLGGSHTYTYLWRRGLAKGARFTHLKVTTAGFITLEAPTLN